MVRVQAGSFSSKETADKAVQELKAKGFGAYVIQSGTYRVVVGYTSNKESAELLGVQLKKAGFTPAIITTSIEGVNATVAGGPEYGAFLKDGIEFANSVIRKETGFWTSYYSGQSLQSIKWDEDLKALEALMSKGTSIKPPSGAEAVYKQLLQLLQAGKDSVNSLKGLSGSKQKEAVIAPTQSYIDFLLQYQTFIRRVSSGT